MHLEWIQLIHLPCKDAVGISRDNNTSVCVIDVFTFTKVNNITLLRCGCSMRSVVRIRRHGVERTRLYQMSNASGGYMSIGLSIEVCGSNSLQGPDASIIHSFKQYPSHIFHIVFSFNIAAIITSYLFAISV